MISVQDVSIRAGAFAMSNVCFEVPGGQYGVLMGRTGSGKTTILEAICGLRPVLAGRILLDGRDVTDSPPSVRGIGYVPQDGALFSSMSVWDHLAFALVVRKWQRKMIRQRVEELADLLGITHLLQRRPKGLSGGERQRVALGRALAARPGILCLDEPLSALDDETHEGMCQLLRSIQAHNRVTTLHVTHHKSETRRLADRVLMIRESAVVETAGTSAP